MTKVRNQYSAEFKLELIKLIEEQGQKVLDVVSQYNVGRSTLDTSGISGIALVLRRCKAVLR